MHTDSIHLSSYLVHKIDFQTFSVLTIRLDTASLKNYVRYIGTGVVWPDEDDDSDKVVFSRINNCANSANSQLHYTVTIIIIIIMKAKY